MHCLPPTPTALLLARTATLALLAVLAPGAFAQDARAPYAPDPYTIPGPYHIVRLPYRGLPSLPDVAVSDVGPDGSAYGSVVNPAVQEPKPARWAPDAPCFPILLPIPGSLFTGSVSDVNAHGVAVGSMSDPSTGLRSRATVWIRDRVSLLPHVGDPGEPNTAGRINDAGIVFGTARAPSTTGSFGPTLVLWNLTEGTVFHDPSIRSPLAANERMQVLLTSLSAGVAGETGPPRVWENGVVTELGAAPGYVAHQGVAINGRGDVAGWSRARSEPGGVEAMLWRRGSAIPLGTAGRDESRALGLNDRGAVVGSARDAFLLPTAILWQDGEAHELERRICGSLAGARLTHAQSISDEGVVTVQLRQGDVDETVLLVPHSHVLHCARVEAPR